MCFANRRPLVILLIKTNLCCFFCRELIQFRNIVYMTKNKNNKILQIVHVHSYKYRGHLNIQTPSQNSDMLIAGLDYTCLSYHFDLRGRKRAQLYQHFGLNHIHKDVGEHLYYDKLSMNGSAHKTFKNYY